MYQQPHLFRARIAALLTLFAHPLFGGVVLDGSFGTRGPLPGPNFMITANLGRLVNTNLFQSFSQFNLINTESATFTGPSNVHNILARVTSGGPSSIDGTIRSDIPGANLFFMNPAGVLFGQHAHLDLSGSFAVTTANYLKLVGGGRFNASLGGGDVLTSSPVSAFGFLNSAPAPVSFTATTLNVSSQKVFSTVAGDITLSGGTITGPGSRANLVSVKSPGEVGLDATSINSAIDVTQFSAMGDIALTNSAKIDTSGPGGGPVVIRGGNLYMDNSQILSQTTGAIQGHAIDIALLANLTISNGAFIFTNALGSGPGGNLDIHTRSLSIDGSAEPNKFTGIAAQTSGAATGAAGDLTVAVDQELNIVGTGQISTSTFSAGNGGNLTIHAGSLLIDSSSTDFQTKISADAVNGTGNAGDLTISVAGLLAIKGGGLIEADTSSRGSGGDVKINAGSILIDGSARPDLFTGIVADSKEGATGNAGDLILIVDQGLRVSGSGQISADTYSSGKGGNLMIHAATLSIDGSATPDQITGIFADSNKGATGNADDLTITVSHALSVTGSSQITADTYSSGKGGNLRIHAGSLLIDSSSTDIQTYISADAVNGTGNAGDLTIAVDGLLAIKGGGLIEADTSTSGKGGEVKINAGSILIDGSARTDLYTGIFADSEQGAKGNAGDLMVSVDGALRIAGTGQISADTYSSGKGGDLTIHAGSILVDGSATPDVFTGISTESQAGATGRAGDLVVQADDLKLIGSGEISSSTQGLGRGGSVNVTANSLFIDGSNAPFLTGISASAFQGSSGKAGNVTVHAGDLELIDYGEIQSVTFGQGDGGNVDVAANSLLINGVGNSAFATGISASAEHGSRGNGGSVAVQADQVTITDRGSISSSTSGFGHGGNVSVKADSLSIDGVHSGIFAAAEVGSTGRSGDVIVDANSLSLQSSGEISAASFTAAAAGSVQLSVGALAMDSGSSISSANTGSGEAGSVVIYTSGPVTLKHDSSISTLSKISDAGSIDITSGGEIKLKDQSNITVSGGRNGGDITITAPDLVYLIDSSITAKALGIGGVGGRGGNITIDPQFIVLQNSFINANAAHGQGGNINLISDFFFNSDLSNNNITATGTTNGTVNISAPALDLGAELITLPASLLSAANQLQERCTALLQGDFSSFISIGRGGTEPAPEELQEEF